MKKINLIDLKKFNGEPLMIDADNVLDVKYVILNHLGTFQGKSGKENILAYTIGQKVEAAKDVIELEDAEYNLIKSDLERQKPLMTALALGQTLQIMEESNEPKRETPKS